MTEMHTQFIENIIFIMKNILDSHTEQPSEHLGITSIEFLMLAIVRYVRHLDSSIHAIQIKTKLCQLVEAVSYSTTSNKYVVQRAMFSNFWKEKRIILKHTENANDRSGIIVVKWVSFTDDEQKGRLNVQTGDEVQKQTG